MELAATYVPLHSPQIHSCKQTHTKIMCIFQLCLRAMTSLENDEGCTWLPVFRSELSHHWDFSKNMMSASMPMLQLLTSHSMHATPTQSPSIHLKKCCNKHKPQPSCLFQKNCCCGPEVHGQQSQRIPLHVNMDNSHFQMLLEFFTLFRSELFLFTMKQLHTRLKRVPTYVLVE